MRCSEISTRHVSLAFLRRENPNPPLMNNSGAGACPIAVLSIAPHPTPLLSLIYTRRLCTASDKQWTATLSHTDFHVPLLLCTCVCLRVRLHSKRLHYWAKTCRNFITLMLNINLRFVFCQYIFLYYIILCQ